MRATQIALATTEPEIVLRIVHEALEEGMRIERDLVSQMIQDLRADLNQGGPRDQVLGELYLRINEGQAPQNQGA